MNGEDAALCRYACGNVLRAVDDNSGYGKWGDGRVRPVELRGVKGIHDAVAECGRVTYSEESPNEGVLGPVEQTGEQTEMLRNSQPFPVVVRNVFQKWTCAPL